MRNTLTPAALLAALFAGLWADAASAQTTRRERVVGLKLVDQHVNAEAYYNGSSFSGGGILSAIATVRIRENGQTRFEERNVTLEADAVWTSSDPTIYDVDFGNFVEGQNGLPDGLYIYGGDSTSIGTTTITVTYKGFTATGSITFWAD